ncbi:hypothetical protein BSAF29S_05405 [Bacillus safensis subsp. safensis]
MGACFLFYYDGKYKQRTHSISSVKVKNISAPVSYSAPYASSSEAILVYLDVRHCLCTINHHMQAGNITMIFVTFWVFGIACGH